MAGQKKFLHHTKTLFNTVSLPILENIDRLAFIISVSLFVIFGWT